MTHGSILVGTSGWRHKHWRGPFYPRTSTQNEWLDFYAGEFPCVEIDSSFYRLPEQQTLARWCERTPEAFRFSIKAPRLITHYKKLKNCEQPIATLLSRLEGLEKRLEPILFQLPARWHRNTRRLQVFLRSLPQTYRYAFEFRDPSWHCDEVYGVLEAHGAALCIHDDAAAPAPLVSTAPFVYLRFHGAKGMQTNRYRSTTLRGWVGKLLGWAEKGKDVYVFFSNDQRASAVKNARCVLDFLRNGIS